MSAGHGMTISASFVVFIRTIVQYSIIRRTLNERISHRFTITASANQFHESIAFFGTVMVIVTTM